MRRVKTEEDGAVAVIVAILLVVLVGAAAFVIDIGDVMWERRMLQNGADAAALAVAIDCAQGDCGTRTEYEGTAAEYADDNNWRGAELVNVRGRDGVVDVTAAGGEVTVTVATRGTEDRPGRLRQWFSGVLGQEQGLGSTAAATAVWGVPTLQAVADNLSVTICAWQYMTEIMEFPPSQAAINALPTIDEAKDMGAGKTIFFKDPTDVEGLEGRDWCQVPPGFYVDPNESGTGPGDGTTGSGPKLPATFGWLESTNCEVEVRTDSLGSWADVKPGNSAGGETACIKDLPEPKVAVLPVVVGIREGDTGRPDEVQIISPAAFYITGYSLAGGGPPRWTRAGLPHACGQSESCIRGFFVQRTGDELIDDDIQDFGVRSVRLIR